MRTFTGIGVSPGGVSAPVVVVLPPEPLPDETCSLDHHEAAARVAQALAEVGDELEARAATLGEDARQMLTAAALMARDEGLLDAAHEQLRAGLGPAHAIQAAVASYSAELKELGGYFAERVSDLNDVGQRAIARVLGRPAPGLPKLNQPCIVVAEDLAPADTATLDPSFVVGLVTSGGGITSHTAILAAQRGIPAVVQAAGVLELSSGTIVALDGDTGRVVAEPDEAVLAGLERRRRARERIDASGPGHTADGHPVALLANIGGPEEARAAARLDVEGVGLFRTEFVFLTATSAPTLEQQTRLYREVLEPFGQRPVTVRALDAGADKPLPFANLGEEPNPALGRRGLRLMKERTELLEVQLAALAAAQRSCEAQVKVMAPMVATLAEAEWFTAAAHVVGLETAGIMIEVPAAALSAEHLLQVSDFASVGTNDLAQYTMAADRMLGQLSELLDPFQPAILRLVGLACAAGHSTGKPVGICGESAADPLMALVLAGLGATSLSMPASRVPLVRHALSLHTLACCQEMAQAAAGARNALDARSAVAALADERLTSLL